MNDYLVVNSPHRNFEGIKMVDELGVEYWEARELMPLLEYSDWRNFQKVILKAQEACRFSKQIVDNHFVEVSKMIKIASGTSKVKDEGKTVFRESIKDICGIMPEDLPVESHIKKLEQSKRKRLKGLQS